MRDFMGRRRRTGAGATGMTGLGLLGAGLGAALMFLFDPEQGRRRRALARDKMASLVRRTGEAMDGRSRHVMNRARGLVIEMRSRLRPRDNGEMDRAADAERPGDVTRPEARPF